MNRVLILSAQSNEPLMLDNAIGLPEDVRLLNEALKSPKSRIDAGHAGSASRFLAAYLAASTSIPIILDGSSRLRERPMAPLIDALRELGADINFLEKDGFLPIEIRPVDSIGGSVHISGDISSQFISGLLLAAPSMSPGLNLQIDGEQVSRPYIRMTLSILSEAGVHIKEREGGFEISSQAIKGLSPKLELDWSAAIFCYSWVAQGMLDELFLPGLNMESMQGDRFCAEVFDDLGVATHPHGDGVILRKREREASSVAIDLSEYPDLAQALIFTCAALGISCHLTGLSTLPTKETNRLAAMKEVLESVGVEASIGEAHISIPENNGLELIADIALSSYDDHRMAMSLALLTPSLGRFSMDDPEVVKKSFPEFWIEARKAGIHIE